MTIQIGPNMHLAAKRYRALNVRVFDRVRYWVSALIYYPNG
jgi:hypothetical protein